MELEQAASVRLEYLSKHFGSVIAVDDVTFEVPAGRLVCLLGPSGCGKTTTLRMIGGFEEPSAGRVYIANQLMNDVPPHRRPTAMVFQSYALFPHMSVFENVTYGLRAHRVPAADIKKQVEQLLELLELTPLASKFPHQLSGGEQQRVALARSLAIRPKVLLLDEPLSNLDAQLRVRVRGEIRALQRKLGITAIYVTHDQEEAFSLSDFTAIMRDGRLVQVGRPMDIYRQPADDFVAQFVGLSNILEGEMLEVNTQGATVQVLGHIIKVASASASPGRWGTIVLRPEMLRLSPAGVEGISARVKTVAFLGPLIRYTVVADTGVQLIVDVHNPSDDQLFPEGTAVTVHLPEEVSKLLPD